MRCDVLVRGAGLVGRAVASELRRRGVDARLYDPHPPGPRAAGLGVVLPLHPEHAHRFLAAVGEARGRAIVAFAGESLARVPEAAWATRDGVRWSCPGPEAGEVGAAVEACAALGVPAWREDGGFRVGTGGAADPAALRASLGEDAVGEVLAEPIPAEVEVVASGDDAVGGLGAWLADKRLPVRWHVARWAGEGSRCPTPTVSRQATVYARADGGDLLVTGARWAEPHLGVGDTDARPLSANVLAMLGRLVAQDFGVDRPPDATWGVVTAESCDGLPIIGPLPGRPRTLVAVGFGCAGLTYGFAAAAAIADGLLGTPGVEVPGMLAAGRFR